MDLTKMNDISRIKQNLKLIQRPELWESVTSSNIIAITSIAEYPLSKVSDLYVKFKSGTYCYCEVPNNIIEEFKKAESLGKYLAQNIKDKYSTFKIS